MNKTEKAKYKKRKIRKRTLRIKLGTFKIYLKFIVKNLKLEFLAEWRRTLDHKKRSRKNYLTKLTDKKRKKKQPQQMKRKKWMKTQMLKNTKLCENHSHFLFNSSFFSYFSNEFSDSSLKFGRTNSLPFVSFSEYKISSFILLLYVFYLFSFHKSDFVLYLFSSAALIWICHFLLL